MRRPEQHDAWQRLSFAEGDAVWAPFKQQYGFRPGVDPATWPAIREPAGSVTFDLAPVWTGPRRTVTEDDVNAVILRACQAISAVEDAMVVLDWQHPCYLFWPHRWTDTDADAWPIQPTPNGDYYIFLTRELSQGSFGHPWEKTLCVFGADFTAAAVPALTSLLPVLRRA